MSTTTTTEGAARPSNVTPEEQDRKAVHAAREALSSIGGKLAKAGANYREAFLAVGRLLWEASETIRKAPGGPEGITVTFVDWARDYVPEPDLTLYRLRSAGAVSTALKSAGIDHEGAAITALTPMGKLIPEGGLTDSAVASIGRTWKKARGRGQGMPSKAKVDLALEALFPEQAKQGKRGPAKGQASNGSTAKASAAKASTAPVREVNLNETADEASVLAVIGEIGRASKVIREAKLQGLDLVIQASMLAAVKIMEQGHPASVLYAGLKSLQSGKVGLPASETAPEAPEAPEASETPEAPAKAKASKQGKQGTGRKARK